MQQFFLFCTMLIIACEAFSKKIYGSQIYKSDKRRTSRFLPKPNYPESDRYVFRDFTFPVFLVPPAYESSDYEQPFFVPVARCAFKPKRRKNYLFRNNRIFSNRKRFRRKRLRRRKLRRKPDVPENSPVFNSGQCFENLWMSGRDFRPQSRRSFTHFLGDFFDSGDAIYRNPNQCIVCLYPMFNQPRNRVNFFKNHRFLNLRRQCLIDRRNKNKRSADSLNATREISHNFTAIYQGKESQSKPQPPDPRPESDIEEAEFRRETGEEEDKNQETDLQERALESPPTYKDDLENTLENPEENYFLQPSLDVATDSYSSDLEDIPPLVTLPKITFKYPYDPTLYEPTLNSSRTIASELQNKKSPPETTTKVNVDNSSHNIGKLKEMLHEVESILKFRGDNTVALVGHKKTSKFGSRDTLKGEVSTTKNDTISLKDKIDTMAIPILNEISEQLGKMVGNSTTSSNSSSDEISQSQNNEKNQTKHSKTTTAKDQRQLKKTSARCSADGTWTSSVLKFDMAFTTMPNMLLKVKITSGNNSVIDKRWSIQGLTLSKSGGPLILAAVYPQKKKVASFIGQCKMCRDQDLIFGSWTIYTCVQKFTDLWKAVETKLDILKKKKEAGSASSSSKKKEKKEKKKKSKTCFGS